MSSSKKQITFDLDTKSLELYYPSSSWRNAYDVIKRYMVRNGFKWIQGSVYVSRSEMKSTEVTAILSELIEKYPWINMCMRDCRETNIGKEHNRSRMFDKSSNIPTRAELQEKSGPKTASMSDWKSRIAERKASDVHSDKSEDKSKVVTNKDRSE